MTNAKLYLLIAALFSLLFFFQYHLWIKSGGISDLLQTKKALSIQVAKNEKLKRNNEELLRQVQQMQTSHDSAESRARQELGMIKKGETFYQIVPNEKG